MMLIRCFKCRKFFHPVSCLDLTPRTLVRIHQLHNGVDIRPEVPYIPPFYETPKEKPLDFKFDYDKVKKSSIPWCCPECKVCVRCSDPSNEDKLLFCDCCDRGYHTYCLTKPLPKPPVGTPSSNRARHLRRVVACKQR